MAKKSRRNRARQQTKSRRTIQRIQPQVPNPVSSVSQSPARVTPKVETLTDRYQHVIPDIKRIGIIAGCMILVLIILSFILG